MTTLPLISCICPTANRGTLLARSVRYFQAQDYPNKELIILEDGAEMHAQRGKGVIYHYSMGHLSIGTKRNLACQMAHGEIITHWDDDDYYGPGRLSYQAAPLLDGNAEVSALTMELLFDTTTGDLLRCPPEAHEKLFKYDVRASTIMYCNTHGMISGFTLIYNEQVPRGEDVRFLTHLVNSGARLARLPSAAHYISVWHGANTTPRPDTTGWETVGTQGLIPF